MWNRKKIIGTTVVIVLLVFFVSIWSLTHKSSDSNQQATTQSEYTSSANDSTASDAEDSQMSADHISINEMKEKIDELNQQIADKDAQIQSLQNGGSGETGGITFQEFLDLYFWPDGNTYRLADYDELYSNYTCSEEYKLNTADYTFSSNKALQIYMNNGSTVYMLRTSDGQIVWCPSPYLKDINS